MMSVAAKAFQMIGLLRPAGRGRDLKATVAKNFNRGRADVAGGAGHQHRRSWGQAGASRATGFSTIGRLITADKRPSRIESHQTAS
jgi:hypothetical protein